MSRQGTKFDQKSRRLRERLQLALPARVYGRESLDSEWRQMTRLVDVTPFGARFRLARPTEPGRLLQLALAMPRKLRAFDHVEDQYRVWSLVRNVKLLDPQKDKGQLVEVGVAFIGKRPPRSYEDDPQRRYDIARTKLESELWSPHENAAEHLTDVPSGDKRKESRQLIPVDVLIEVIDENRIVESENTVTENISPKGAAVFTALDVAPGTFVKMSSERHHAAVLAVVRGRRIGPDGIARLHLEFAGGEWPL